MSRLQTSLFCLIYICTHFVDFTLNVELTLDTIYVKALAGSPVEIPCGCSSRVSPSRQGRNVTWVKGQSGPLIISRGRSRQKVKVGKAWKDSEISLKGSDLTIPDLQFPRDHGEFVCSMTSDDSNVVVTVLAPVQTVTISEAKLIEGRSTLDVPDGGFATVSCAALANPRPSFRWHIETGTLPTAIPNNSTDAYTNSVRFPVTRDMNGKTIECMAKNDLGKWVKVAAYMRVLRPPTNAVISVTPNSLTAVEGDNVRLRCQAEGTPTPAYRWVLLGKADSVIRNISSSAIYTISSIRSTQAGSYQCIATNTMGQTSERTKISVMYPPRINVTYDEDTKTLSCTAKGRPLVVQFDAWQQVLDGHVISTHPGRTQGQTTVLHLSGLTYEDTGYYVCRAANSVKGVQSAGVYVQPRAKPVFQGDQPSEFAARLRQPLEISVLYYAHPQPSIVRWDKSRVDGIHSRAHKHTYKQRQQSANVTLTFHGTLVTLPGTAAIFSFRRVKKADAGNYTLTLGNPRGLSVFRFSVSVEHPRHGPSEDSSVGRHVTYALVGVGASVFLIVVIALLCVCGVIPFPGRKSKSSDGYSPARDNDKADAWADISNTDDRDTFRGVNMTDVMLKEDVNENHQL